MQLRWMSYPIPMVVKQIISQIQIHNHQYFHLPHFCHYEKDRLRMQLKTNVSNKTWLLMSFTHWYPNQSSGLAAIRWSNDAKCIIWRPFSEVCSCSFDVSDKKWYGVFWQKGISCDESPDFGEFFLSSASNYPLPLLNVFWGLSCLSL